MLSVVTILALLLPLAAHTVFQSHIDLLLARNFRDQTDAMYVAEAGLEHALMYVGGIGSMRALLLGPDQTPASADDGEFPIPLQADGLGRGRTYTVRVSKLGATRLQVTSVGAANNGASRAVAALLQGGDSPFTPAALFLAGGARPITLDRARLDISGQDASASAQPVADWAFADSGASATATAASPLSTRVDVDAIAAQLAAAALAIQVAPGPAPETLGVVSAPQLTIVDGDLRVSATTSGAGLLLVRGGLQISATLRFDGLVIVIGPLESSADSETLLAGALWQASGSNRTVLAGRGFLHYSSIALALADTVAADILPHTLRVLGRYEPS